MESSSVSSGSFGQFGGDSPEPIPWAVGRVQDSERAV
jgi:hypothetical protein